MPRFIPLNRNGLTARMVLSVTPAATINRARNVRISSLKASPNTFGFATYAAVTRTATNDDGTVRKDGQSYRTTITVRDRHSHIHVDCECAYHPFWGAEVALSLRKAADMIRSNGRAPETRNPALTPYCCKHAAAVLLKLLSMQKLK